MKNQLKIDQLMNPTTQQPNDADVLKTLKKTNVFLMFLLCRPCYLRSENQYKYTQHPSKDSSQNHCPTGIDFRANLAIFLVGFGCQVGPKMAIKSNKIRSNNQPKK